MTWLFLPALLAMPWTAFFTVHRNTHSCQVEAVFMGLGYVLVVSGVVMEEFMADFGADS